MIPAKLSDAFTHQANACRQLGSPFMGQLCDLLAQREWPNTSLRDRYFSWQGDVTPRSQSLPLRLAGGLHALVLSNDPLAAVYPPQVVADNDLWDAVYDAMVRQDKFLNDWVDSPPQTNEVRRSAVLIAVGHFLADKFNLPIRLSELGASGGLNLMWDKFALDVRGNRYGPANATVLLNPEWSGPLPPQATPTVVSRRGVDLNPLDPTSQQDQLRLRAYLWPDQTDRMQRTVSAIAVNDAKVDQADAVEWLGSHLAHQSGQLHMIYSTIAWQYLPAAAQARGKALIEAAGKTATHDTPLAWFRMEPDDATPGAAMTLRIWPLDRTINLGRVDFHGRWVSWEDNL